MRRIELQVSRSTRYDYDHTSVLGSDAIVPGTNDAFVDLVLTPKRLHYASRTKTYSVTNHGFDVASTSLAVQAVHNCFDRHVDLSLRPEVLWYMIVHEVATYVKADAASHAHLFTATPGQRQLIEVRDDSLSYDRPSNWAHTIELFRQPLREAVSDRTVELFLPAFSTHTAESETALLVAFMDAASPYYEYEVFTRCGIPAVQLEGKATDWQLLAERTTALAQEFPGLADYFRDLLPVVSQIAATAAGGRVDEEFWTSVYKYEDSSGGATVSGWITAFFAHVQTPDGLVPKTPDQLNWRKLHQSWRAFKPNQFPSHLSRVPFVWDYYGNRINMAFAGGVLGVDLIDDALQPQLGFAVVEV